MGKIYLLGLSLCMLAGMLSCSQTRTYDSYEDPDNAERNKMDLNSKEKTLSLKDYLVRFPGLYWANDRIMLKENSSILSQREPLYIVDGVKIGNDYSKVESIVDPNDIRSVEVLTNASETSIYGLDGNNGVILIRTKN